MSVQIALLKSGEEVIADIKEFRDSDDNLVSYFFGEPHCIRIKTQEVLIEAEDAPPKHELIFYKWMGLSKDKDIIVNKDPELSVHSGTNNQFGLIDIARASFPLLEIDLCHRIDLSLIHI